MQRSEEWFTTAGGPPKKTEELSELLSGIIEHQQPLDGIPDDDQPLEDIPDDDHLDSSDETEHKCYIYLRKSIGYFFW